MSRFSTVLAIAAALTVALAGVEAQQQGITNEQLNKGLADPGAWLNYGGDYGGMRHSPLTQITATNVGQLSVASGRPSPSLSAALVAPV